MSLTSRFEEPELSPVAVDWELGFTRAATKSGLLYWRSLLARRAMPERHDLDPRAMARFLSFVSLVDVCAAAPGAWNYVVTLQGSHSREVLGAVQGQKLADIFAPAVAARWRGCFDLSRSSRLPVRLMTRATMSKTHLDCEALIAPLGSSGGVDALFWVFDAWRENQFAVPQKPRSSAAGRATAAR
jgi:hypothetical protein